MQPVGQRVIDFVVRNTETAKQLFIEVKYGLPSSADALSRLVAQVQAASQAESTTVSALRLLLPRLKQEGNKLVNFP
jgi:hypothetical protein